MFCELQLTSFKNFRDATLELGPFTVLVGAGGRPCGRHVADPRPPNPSLDPNTTPIMQDITSDDFEQVELRAGTVTRVEDFPEARTPAYKIWADFGDEIGVLKSSAQVTDLYTTDELKGRQIIGVVNVPPKQIGPFTSEFLVTGFYRDNGDVVLAESEQAVPDGSALA